MAATTRTSTRCVRVPPRRSNSLLLQHAQQLRLQLERDVADLVEKQRAAVRQLEAADPLRDRAGERAALVAEELALQQAGRESPRSSP